MGINIKNRAGTYPRVAFKKLLGYETGIVICRFLEKTFEISFFK
jgi:hypothetical protein